MNEHRARVFNQYIHILYRYMDYYILYTYKMECFLSAIVNKSWDSEVKAIKFHITKQIYFQLLFIIFYCYLYIETVQTKLGFFCNQQYYPYQYVRYVALRLETVHFVVVVFLFCFFKNGINL